MSIEESLNYELLQIGKLELKVVTIIGIALVLFVTKMLIIFVKKALIVKNYLKTDPGTSFAIYQILRYLFWVFALYIILNTLGIELGILVASSAALFVGIGLGLQNTFNDFISGFILLFDGSIKVGDILEIDGEVVKMKSIGFRTSKCINRDDIIFILPNSNITNSKIINRSAQHKTVRFKIEVGVSYDSNPSEVKNILEGAVKEHGLVTNKNKVLARLRDFSDSALLFDIVFFCDEIFWIERVKAEIRMIIFNRLKEANISIPFPQVDVHFKNTN